MSIHRSLVARGKLGEHRNVLSRAERIKRLAEQGRWQPGQSVWGLPKVRNIKMKARRKAKKEEEAKVAAAAGAEAAPAAGSPAPAAPSAEKPEKEKKQKEKT
jgi:small basic protein (TIGR04137 family)